MEGLEVQVPVHVWGLPINSSTKVTMSFLRNRVPMKRRVLSLRTSTVNLLGGHMLLRWSRGSAAVPFFMVLHVL